MNFNKENQRPIPFECKPFVVADKETRGWGWRERKPSRDILGREPSLLADSKTTQGPVSRKS